MRRLQVLMANLNTNVKPKSINYVFIFIKVSHFTAEVSIQAKSMCFFSNFAVTFA